jgi:hypothetical protein
MGAGDRPLPRRPSQAGLLPKEQADVPTPTAGVGSAGAVRARAGDVQRQGSIITRGGVAPGDDT